LSSNAAKPWDAIIIGAGAAGMMCAAEAGLRGRRVLLIEHAPIVAERIRISGGGRCNFTNRDVSPANFLSRNPDFCRSALARFTAQDFIARIEQRGIRYHEKTLGQLFCDDSSRQVIDLLVDAVADAGVQWAHPCAVHRVAAIGTHPHDRFELVTDHGTVRCASIVVATGGIAVPKPAPRRSVIASPSNSACASLHRGPDSFRSHSRRSCSRRSRRSPAYRSMRKPGSVPAASIRAFARGCW
jgi:predicted Rossmann fold flavoprotein